MVFVSTTAAFAQKFTVRGGLAVSNVQFFIDTASIEPAKKPGFFLGIDSEFELAQNLYLGVGSDFIQKGFRVKADTVILADFSLRINYLSIPINIRYKFDLEDFWMTFEAGPYFGVGLSAKSKSGEDKSKIHFGQDEGEINSIDYGFNLGFGFEVDIVRFGINYSNGLNNISSSKYESMKNRCFTVSFGITL